MSHNINKQLYGIQKNMIRKIFKLWQHFVVVVASRILCLQIQKYCVLKQSVMLVQDQINDGDIDWRRKRTKKQEREEMKIVFYF